MVVGIQDAHHSGLPVSLIQNEHLNAAEMERGAIVEMINETTRRGNEDVRRSPESCFLRLHVQTAYKSRAVVMHICKGIHRDKTGKSSDLVDFTKLQARVFTYHLL